MPKSRITANVRKRIYRRGYPFVLAGGTLAATVPVVTPPASTFSATATWDNSAAHDGSPDLSISGATVSYVTTTVAYADTIGTTPIAVGSKVIIPLKMTSASDGSGIIGSIGFADATHGDMAPTGNLTVFYENGLFVASGTGFTEANWLAAMGTNLASNIMLEIDRSNAGAQFIRAFRKDSGVWGTSWDCTAYWGSTTLYPVVSMGKVGEIAQLLTQTQAVAQFSDPELSAFNAALVAGFSCYSGAL